MAKKKAKKKVVAAPAEEVVVEEAPVAKEKPGKEVVSEAAHVPEMVVTRRGTSVGGTRTMSKEDYDKEIEKERGKPK